MSHQKMTRLAKVIHDAEMKWSIEGMGAEPGDCLGGDRCEFVADAVREFLEGRNREAQPLAVD